MAIFKRGKFYWYEFEFKGQRIRESAKVGDKDVARQIESAHRVRLAKGEAGIEERAPAPTLRKFSETFLKQIRMDCASKPRTVKFYEGKLARLLAHGDFADVRLDQIDSGRIEAYKRMRSSQATRRKKPTAPASINRELATLRRLLRMAAEWKIIAAPPRIKLLRGETPREFVLSREDEQRYLDALAPHLRALCTFLLDTGLRVGEAITLEWPSVHLKEKPGYVTVRAVLAKGKKTRSIDLTPRARRVLEATKGRAGVVFRNADGERLYHTWVDQQHAAVRKLLALPDDFVIHSLRHTFGTRLGEGGADIRTIMDLMGHASLAVAQKYVHPSTDAKRRAIERLGEAVEVPTKVPTSLRTVRRKKRVSRL